MRSGNIGATYADIDIWREYDRRLPAAFRLADEHPEEEIFRWRGLPVHVDRLPAPGAPLKLVLVHGIGGYGRIVLPFGAPFLRTLCEVVSPDLPGYGLTPAPEDPLLFSTWTSCMQSLIDAELERDGRRIVAFGLSLGGMVAYHTACISSVHGLIATAFIDMREPEVAAGVSRFPRLSRLILPLLEYLPDFLCRVRIPSRLLSKMHAISNDPALSRLVSRDPYGGGNSLPLSFLRSIVTSEPSIFPERFERCPVLLVHPGADRMTDIRFSRRFYDRLAAPKCMRALDNAGHWPIEEPGATQMRESVGRFLERLAGKPATARSSGERP